ncbi:MAG: hypothetical protein A2925_04860 [Candidatus Yanofskybacteria bacterium RIFCSPLOWO2_01_FULL_44_22]|uniref:Reverse transcriptase domain-containing protein n=1 Tax=Candidatus Yanofskybacteria bacterium RIFCSPLOWO2_01_FULL_44_22 TaxID=1802697 RepID=A0A1F8GM39_9BACT|nr:MAG: hypothetical protein A2925_04860 [Candidatus Yanofskybacteria bacterium RIFCSPLOWO2_01_FULL_44_22]
MSSLFERFSSRENLKKAYKYVLEELAHSSLSVTPINHASITAINNLGDQFFIALEKCLRDEKYVPEKGYFVYIPKDNLGLRPVCIPAMVDRIVYQAILNQRVLGYKIDGQLSDKVCFSNRVNDKEDGDSFLSPYFNGYDAFIKKQKKAFEKGFVWKLELDVQQYYEHISIKKLIDKLQNDFDIKDEKILAILHQQLNAWVEYEDLPKGIPQGPNASAVLSNAYLSSLDKFVEDKLNGKELLCFRYADDIVLMGKTKEAILRATEKIVRFLREHNLVLNEKTQIAELKDSGTIEAMRIMSDYEDNTPEIPEDEFAVIQANVPVVIEKIANNEKVDKLELRQLKYYLKVGREYNLDFLLSLIGIIPLRPSLTILVVQYVAEGRQMLDLFGDTMDTVLIDQALWGVYNNAEVSEWSKFWILKLLVSSRGLLVGGMDKEMKRILASKGQTIFKIVALYYQTIKKQKINIDLVKRAISDSISDVERSWYAFFFLKAFEGERMPVIRDCIEKLLNANSQELNLIGSYLYQSKPQVKIDNIEGPFSSYILQRKKRVVKVDEKKSQMVQDDYYLVRKDALIPVSSPTSMLGVNRKRRLRHTIDLPLPETMQWEKVTLKMKDGLKEVEIWYDGKHLATVDYIQLGFFTGKKQQNPDRSWGFISALSVLSATDITQATAPNMRRMVAVNTGITLKTANVHQIKKTVTNRLRAIFKTDENPFHDNKNYYHPRFTLLPPPALRQEEVWQQGGKLNENLPYEDTELNQEE